MWTKMLILVAALGVAACDEKTEDKPEDLGTIPTYAPKPRPVSDEDYERQFQLCKEGKKCEEFEKMASAGCLQNRSQCAGFAVLIHYIGSTGTVNNKAARSNLAFGCEGGHQAACITLGSLFEDAWYDDNFLQSRDWIEAACKNDNQVACGNLVALLARTGEETTLDVATLADTACKANIPAGCSVQSVFVHKAKDLEGARKLSLRACELNSRDGCWNAAIVLDRGEGGAKDPDQAIQLGKKACELGHALACERTKMLSPWIHVKTVPEAEMLSFEVHQRGTEKKRIKGDKGEDAFIDIVKKRKLSVRVHKGDSDIDLGDFDKLASVEAVIVKGTLFVLVYEVTQMGKINSTQAFRFSVDAKSVTKTGAAKGEGRLDFRSAAFEG